ncbi:MAG: dTDP-glucose 4,6-dehydratase [Burkholderiaceae bacterium]
MILVTGGAGFIGANFILHWLSRGRGPVVNLDKLTYAGNTDNLTSVAEHADYEIVVGDIGDQELISQLLTRHQPSAIVNFAAESHVDRSISGPGEFIQTNITGTFGLLQASLAHFRQLPANAREQFRFLHVSTDEVFGSLGPDDPGFSETTPYAPNSPYSASKAASDHLVRAYHHTYGLPTLTTNCSNNYGPFQFPEKLIPLIVLNALAGKQLPIYGDGQNVRDWLYVTDHCDAIATVLDRGVPGETYNIGGNNEMKNLDVVDIICQILDQKIPKPSGQYKDQIEFVRDRPGHDQRYAIDATRMRTQLQWEPRETFDSGIEKTIDWYLNNKQWVERVQSGQYRQWVEQNYGRRNESESS